MSLVRLYGPTIGYGSFANVIRGMRIGLGERLAGVVPIDCYTQDREEQEEARADDPMMYLGFEAPVGMLVGNPMMGVGLMRSAGQHKERWFLLPPNSTYVPETLLLSLRGKVDVLVSPSRWGADMLREKVGRHIAVKVWQHGVHPDFLVEAPSMPTEPPYRLLHLASTMAERKGTIELLRALALLPADASKLVERLDIVLEGAQQMPRKWAQAADAAGMPVRLLPRWNKTPAELREALQGPERYHIVCQPSRGEGFGLVPLEARAAGACVVMSDATGHMEHAYTAALNLESEVVPQGPYEPIDDGDGALAPAVDPAQIASALTMQLLRFRELEPLRAARAKWLRESGTFHWKTTTDDFLEVR